MNVQIFEENLYYKNTEKSKIKSRNDVPNIVKKKLSLLS